MSRYADMTAAEIIDTMGAAQKQLMRVAGGYLWAHAHPSTRDALVTRGLVERVTDSRGDRLHVTARGREVAGALWAAEQEKARETVLPHWSGDVPLFGEVT